MKSKLLSNLFVLLFVVCIVSCSGGCSGPNDIPEMKNNEYTLYSLDYHDLYYTYLPVYYDIFPPFQYEMDSSGVILSRYLYYTYYNPVSICLRGINLYDRYVNVQDSLYLDYAFRHRDALIELMDDEGYFEYRMNYHHFDIVLFEPWYSGMAQGLALSLLSRLAYYTEDSLSAEVAHKVYKTLDPNLKISAEVVDIDTAGYAWIEEYPGDPPDRTFNGFMHAIIGVYDYYHLLKPNAEVGDVLSAYLTTVEAYMREYRNPGNISFYCIRHHHTDHTYHKIHVQQLDLFTSFTHDSTFALFADTLETDYWNY